jgi:hypothetical protein
LIRFFADEGFNSNIIRVGGTPSSYTGPSGKDAHVPGAPAVEARPACPVGNEVERSLRKNSLGLVSKEAWSVLNQIFERRFSPMLPI